MQIQANSTHSVTHSQNPTTTQPQVDETKFIAQGDLPDSIYNTTGDAQIVFKPTSPDEAWQQYAFSTSGSMIEVSSTIPAGYQDVNAQLKALFTEQGIDVPDGLTISYGIPEKKSEFAEEEASKEPQFLIKNVDDPLLSDQIEELLNNPENAHFKKSYLALDRLTAAENTTQAELRDSLLNQPDSDNKPQGDNSLITYGYKQDFSMSFDGENWLMNTSTQLVELMRVEKAPR
ncbi:hypothetical protein [Neptuniibacter sp. QD48_11]|uniref:hypothetical protein n=1 Tax=Neptuniibacter sp. QD48_11 TaxID=3398211 RepID=UPI0039F56D5A